MNVTTKKLDSLTLDPENARKHSDRNIDAIAASLTQFGQRKPIVITADGVVLAGNGTVVAARKLGWAELAVTVAPKEWTRAQAKAYALADNRTAELAEWDESVLAAQLIDLDTDGWDIEGLGFEQSISEPEPVFLPTDEPQPRLDQRNPTCCPQCGFEWRVGPQGEIEPV